jgi:hypothetical protein
MHEKRRNVIDNRSENRVDEGTRNDMCNWRKGIWRWVQHAFVVDSELSEDRNPIDQLVGFASDADLLAHQVAQTQKPHFRFRVAGLAPIGQQPANRKVRLRKRSLRTNQLQARQEARNIGRTDSANRGGELAGLVAHITIGLAAFVECG